MSGIEVKYPQVIVRLTESDGNAFAIMGAVTKEMRRFGLTKEQIEEFTRDAMSGDYDHLLQTVIPCRWTWLTVSTI